MDKYLLSLWNAGLSGGIKQSTIAELLGLSQKQTARYIAKWTEQGWLTFTSGRGRGNVSNLQWLKDVEGTYEEIITDLIDEEPLDTVSKYLLYDWSSQANMRLMNKFRTKFGYSRRSDEIDKLVIPRRNPFLTVHPLEVADAHSANMVANVYNRLVAVDEDGMISPEIAHSWDLSETQLRLYLKKDVKFHDGSLLSAEDAVTCLERLRREPNFQDLWMPVHQISTASPLVIDIHFPMGCSYILQMLGTMNASIYKESKGGVHGTGAFFIEENNEQKSVLSAFKDYFRERPLLDAVEYVQVPKDFDMVYRSASQESVNATYQVESSSGFGVVIMNATRKSPIQRKEVRDYVHYIISKHRHEIGECYSRALPNNQSCFMGEDHQYSVPAVRCPVFEEPLVVRGLNYTKQTTLWLVEKLKDAGVPVVLKWLSFQDAVKNAHKNDDVDLFIHGEIFEMNHDFSFYFFLINGYSPMINILKSDEKLVGCLGEYMTTEFSQWRTLNLKMEKMLLGASIMVPLYHEKRQIPFSEELMNISISHFGYVDFAKLWVRPNLD